MQIKLPADLERYVREQVESGQYASIDELAAEAIRVLRHVKEGLPDAEDELRREIDRGLHDIEEGRIEDWNPEHVIEQIRKRAVGKKAS